MDNIREIEIDTWRNIRINVYIPFTSTVVDSRLKIMIQLGLLQPLKYFLAPLLLQEEGEGAEGEGEKSADVRNIHKQCQFLHLLRGNRT